VFEEWAAAGPRARSDLQNFWEGMAKLCAAPTAENWEALMRQQNDKDSRTCSISVNPFEQTFTQQDADVWVHNGEPGGICGVIAIATFEREPGGGVLWNYRTREVARSKFSQYELTNSCVTLTNSADRVQISPWSAPSIITSREPAMPSWSNFAW
jgi:hypothetical protein